MDDKIKEEFEKFYGTTFNNEELLPHDLEFMHDDYRIFKKGYEACLKIHNINGEKNGTR